MNLLDVFRSYLYKRKAPKPRYRVVHEGEFAAHRLPPRNGRRGTVRVPVLRAHLIDRNKYDPQTCSRPKEAAKAALRAT